MSDNGRAMDPGTLLRDPIVRSILAVLALLTSILLFFVGQWWWRRKLLTYTVSDVRLLRVHRDVKERVQILFDGNPANDVALVIITINNSGHEAIRGSDFERALEFNFGVNSRMLTLEIVEKHPKTLRPELKSSLTGFVLEPLLLNKGDWIKVKVLVNEMAALEVDGRVAGVREIRRVGADSVGLRVVVGAALVFASALLAIIADYVTPKRLALPEPSFSETILSVSSIICMGGAIFSLLPFVTSYLQKLKERKESR
jgi:hypothetical protein